MKRKYVFHRKYLAYSFYGKKAKLLTVHELLLISGYNLKNSLKINITYFIIHFYKLQHIEEIVVNYFKSQGK